MFGRNLLNTHSLLPTRVSADNSPIYKPAGVTLDWTLLTTPTTDTTLPDGSIIRAGVNFLRYGQVLTQITLAGTDVVTITGSPTGGTFTVSVTAGGSTQTTAGVAYNASAATLQTAIQGLSNVGTGNATVTGSAGGPYTITFANLAGTVTVTASGAALTGGTSPAAAATQTSDNNVGMYGPYDPAAGDGRQTLTRGQCFVLDETILQYNPASQISGSNDQTGRVIEGGLIWLARVLQSSTGGASLAAGPTLANFLAAFPLFSVAAQ